jgi:hypothetical protein
MRYANGKVGSAIDKRKCILEGGNLKRILDNP